MGFFFDACASKSPAPNSERTSDPTVQSDEKKKKTERQGHSVDPIYVESIKQARWGQRICAVPAVGWYSMGTISQHSLPLLADVSDNRFLEIGTFDLHAEYTHVMQLFQEPRVEFW